MFNITNTTKKRVKTTSFEEIKNKVLGERYELSLVFCGDKLSRKLNRTYRKKDYPTNVLSFPISKTEGEIFINQSHTKGFSIAHLFIHGLLHLKGMQHGDRMEAREKALLKAFGL